MTYDDGLSLWIESGNLILSGNRTSFTEVRRSFQISTQSGHSLNKIPSGRTAAEQTNRQIEGKCGDAFGAGWCRPVLEPINHHSS